VAILAFPPPAPTEPTHPTHRVLLAMIAINPSPGVATMCEATRLTKRAVLYALSRLAEDGWIIITERGRGRGRRTTYDLVEKVQKRCNEKGAKKVQNGTSEPRACAPLSLVLDLGLNQDQDLNKNTLSAPFPFEDFWAIWPKKDGKADAQRAWKKLTLRDQQAATAAVSLDSRLYGVDRKFVPWPATWLNARRWEDETVVGVATAVIVPDPEPSSLLPDATVLAAQAAFRARQEAARASQTR